MARLIDANALLSAIDEYMGNVYGCPLNEVAEFQSASNDTKVVYAVEGLYEATEIIDEQPTVDAVEVVHGRWKPVKYNAHCSCGKSYGTYHYLCSACNRISYAQPYGLNYCPNCGAHMDLEVNNATVY